MLLGHCHVRQTISHNLVVVVIVFHLLRQIFVSFPVDVFVFVDHSAHGPSRELVDEDKDLLLRDIEDEWSVHEELHYDYKLSDYFKTGSSIEDYAKQSVGMTFA